jgi:hypothetical protein
MKIVISIFSLPHEIDDLEKTLNQLKIASTYISNKTEWVLDVSMTLSDELVNWKKSSIPKQYFVDKFMKLSAHTDWCMKTFRISDDIKGCVSQRRFTTLEYTDADFFIWLDTDIIFDERTLAYFETILPIVSQQTNYSIVTPEIVRYWDTTWDCLVNDEFKNKPLNYQRINDPFVDSGIKGEVGLESVSASIRNQPRFKFAGGWMTCLSGDLVRRIGVPESFGHYGYEDTFIMWGAEKLMKATDINIQQFKIKNLVVCENYKYRNNSHYINNISAFDKREEYKQIAESKFNEELNKLT